jgi:hypothetical protein
VVNEPPPGTAGTRQSMIVEQVSPGTRWFAVRSFDASGNRSAVSNEAHVEVK